MNELKQHALLLSAVALLVIIKFIYLPISDWQSALYMEIQQQQKKLSQVGVVLSENDELLSQKVKLTQALTVAEQVFFPYQVEADFQLKQQIMLEKILEQHKLKLTRFGWENSRNLSALSVTHYQLQVFLSGNTLNFIQLMAALELQSPYIEVGDFVLNVQRQKAQDLGQVSGNLTLHLYANNKIDR
jgi:hypothetical protein